MNRLSKRISLFLLMILMGLFSLSGCYLETDFQGEAGRWTVHFIDVGQADAVLIQSDGHSMLIDAGNRDDGDFLVSYLRTQGVRTLDFVIATHPHEDHIGGMTQVIQSFPVDTVIVSERDHPTRNFESMLLAIEDQDCNVIQPVAGSQYTIGEGEFTLLSPVSDCDYEDNLNNTSIGIRLVLGETSFILCGDAEKEAEEDIIQSGQLLQGTVLKLSHHGSSTSTSDAFLEAVDPEYAVISCGAGNQYGHPHDETLYRLAKEQIPYFRTDTQGTIVAAGDDTGWTWNADPIRANVERQTYCINTNTMKFHDPACSSVQQITPQYREDVYAAREELVAEGYSPCGRCKP